MKQVQQSQTQRLKQILFPRKTTSRIIIKQSSRIQLKQNHQTTNTTKFNIKQQINKLKHGIQLFMEKQSFNSQNLLITPRECLELIKYMSDSMINYREEIQEAITTLIESIPKPINKVMPTTKYFLNQIKFGYFAHIFIITRKRIVSESFQLIKATANCRKDQSNRYEQKKQIFINKLILIRRNKLFWGLNRWRINCLHSRKQELQEYYHQNNLVQVVQQIRNFSDQSRLIVYLQKLLAFNTTADSLEILLYNPKTYTLRGYKVEHSVQNIGSAFESVHNHSQLSIQNQTQRNNKIKRLQFVLQHSLTKICLLKKQTIRIQQMRKDQDYSSIDDYTLFHGLSARQNMGGCIFTPLVHRNICLGIVRQYYYTKICTGINNQQINMLIQLLQNGIKSSNIFQQTKQKSLAIRNKHYLKAILLKFNADGYQKIWQLLTMYYKIKYISVHSYRTQTNNNIKNYPHFNILTNNTINITNNSINNNSINNNSINNNSINNNSINNNNTNNYINNDNLTDIMVALTKMQQNKNNYLYEDNKLYIRINDNIYIFQIIIQKNKEDLNIPIQIIINILHKLQFVKQNKQKQFQQLVAEQQRLEKLQQQLKIVQRNKNILEYCMNINNLHTQQQLIKVMNYYLQHFIPNLRYQSVRIIQKSKFKNKQNNNFVVIHTNQNVVIVVDVPVRVCEKTNTSDQIIQDSLRIPLVNLCNNLVSQMTKYITISQIRNLQLKQQIYYNPQDIDKSIINLITNTLHIQKQQYFSIKSTQNPFTDQSYSCFIQTKYCHAQTSINNTTGLIKNIKLYSYFIAQTINPLSTILCLDNQLYIVINNKILIKQQIVHKFVKIYKRWKYNRQQAITNQTIRNRNLQIIKGGFKIVGFFMKNMSDVFGRIVNCGNRIKIVNNFAANYINRENMKLLNYAFLKIDQKNNTAKLQNKQLTYNRIQLGCKLIISGIMKLFGPQSLYNIYKTTLKITKNLTKLHTFYKNKQLNLLRQSYHKLIKPNYNRYNSKFNIFKQLYKKIIYTNFQGIRRYSIKKQCLSLTQSQTQCTLISKMYSIYKIYKELHNKYENYQVYLYLKNGIYMGYNKDKIIIFEQLSNKIGYQHYQFIAQNKSKIKNIVWLVPDSCIITLIQKHYLQVLSRAIEQGFQKFIYNNQQFVRLLNIFFSIKIKKLLRKSLNTLRNYTMNKIKAQQYSLRDKYYQTSIQVQNYKLMQKQQKLQQQQRIAQINQSVQLKNKYQKSLYQHRQQIVRLQLSSRKLQQMQAKQKNQNQRKQAIRIFNLWRIQALYRKKYSKRRQLARKRQVNSLKSIYKFMKIKIKQNLDYSLKRIMIQSANYKARNLSAQKNIKNMEIKDSTNNNINRLLTFQDQFNQFQQQQQLMNTKRDISIIPISFKHFEGSKKQNYDVTNEEMNKINQGAYKLNAKTLKFLKRMGKLNN